jgi:UBX domain-containing protein 1
MKTLKDLEELEQKDAKKQQEFYTGGSQSGQNVLARPSEEELQGTETASRDSRYGDMFNEAIRHGAINRDLDQENERSRARNTLASYAFIGRGRTMNEQEIGEEEEAEEEELDGDVEEEEEGEGEKEIERVVTFWNNGFTVDDGPLRDPRAPENQEFMQMISIGQAPRELLIGVKASQRNPIKIDLKREHRDFEEPKGLKAFSGAGNKLTATETSTLTNTTTLSEVDKWEVDENAPQTSIQIRLANGDRLVAKFNLTHTVAHIRDFIRKAKGDESACKQLRLAGFPPEKLDDDSRVISDGLKGCVVQQL